MQEFLDKPAKYKPAGSTDEFSAMVMSIDVSGVANLTVWYPDKDAEHIVGIVKAKDGDDGSLATWRPE